MIVKNAKRGWGGAPPASPADARRRLLEAALRCFTRKGVTGTTVTDVAREAQVSRPTVYKYFADRDAMVRALLLHAAPAFTGQLAARLAQSRGLEEGLVDAVLYCMQALPSDPLFGVLFRDDSAVRTSQLVLGSPELLDGAAALLEPILAPARKEGRVRPGLATADLLEWAIRLVFSYALVPSPRHGGDAALRGLLRRLLLPAVLVTEAAEGTRHASFGKEGAPDDHAQTLAVDPGADRRGRRPPRG